MLKVTVVIPTKNGGALFKRVLSSALSQKTDWKYRVLVVDSGSSDGTLEYLKTCRDVSLLEIPAQQFQHGATRNFALENCNSEFAALLTHDAQPAGNEWLANLVAAAESRVLHAGSFGRHLPYLHCDPFMQHELEAVFNGLNEYGPIHENNDHERYRIDSGYRQVLHFFSNNNSCVRLSVWKKIPFPEVNFAEDQAWANRVIEAGYSIGYAHDACVFHSHSFNTMDTFKRAFDESRAMNQLFGYDLTPSIKQLVKNSVAQLKIDRSVISLNKLHTREPITVIKRPFRVVARQIGAYLGPRSERLGRAANLLSLDDAKKRGDRA